MFLEKKKKGLLKSTEGLKSIEKLIGSWVIGGTFIPTVALLRFYDSAIHFCTRGPSPYPVLSLDKYVLAYEDWNILWGYWTSELPFSLTNDTSWIAGHGRLQIWTTAL